MKLYLLVDMEGISGIRKIEQVKRDTSEYEEGRQLMMGDVNVAIDACFSAGATEVVACDTHGSGGQIRVGAMDSRATYETPNAGRMMPSLDESFSGVILLGHHAMAGIWNGFLDHTMSSMSWFRFRLNGVDTGEIGMEAAHAGHYGVPVVVVTGDEAACREAERQLGAVETAVVKWGVGRNRARCLPVPKAHEVIRQAVTRALTNIDRFAPFKPELPATMELTLYRSDMADDLERRTDVVRVDARTVKRTAQSFEKAHL